MKPNRPITVAFALCLLLLGPVANATTLTVHCDTKPGLASIGAALKHLQQSGWASRGPNTINVSGACKENVLIQSMDRLTLNAVNGASITDTSGGKLDVISIQDSWDVAIKRFTVNAGAGVGNGITCGDFSTCRLSGNVIQGATSAVGFFVAGRSQATLDGDTLQNNDIGVQVLSSSGVRLSLDGRPFTSRGNGRGVDIRRGAFALITAVIENNSDVGVAVLFHSTLELRDGSISGSGSVGALVSQGSFARFASSTISGNAEGGVVYSDLSMGDFTETTVIGNGSATDVVCNPQFAATRGTDTIGGTTNCVEP